MLIFKYFKPAEKELLHNMEPKSSECKVKELCNEELEKVYTAAPVSKTRGKYTLLSPDVRVRVGKFASEHSIPKTLEHYTDLNLKRTTVRNLKNAYIEERSRTR